MDIDRFKQLVARLERESAVSPGVYRAKVAALTLLGFGILLLFLAAAGAGLLALAGFAAVVALTGGKALILLLKAGKLLLLLAVPLWYLVKNGVQALFIRFPPPEGREITRDEAPALFAEIDRMRTTMKGPRFHHVLIVDEVNAAVVQRPAFGLIGWPRNYLLLGLPLLEGMAPEEALAVVAHEYGHLAGADGRFGAFIYRLRHTWATIEAVFEQMSGWVNKLMAPLLRWYVPYFNAYTFVLARANEYQADAASARLVGVEHAQDALKRSNILGPRYALFMERTLARIDHEAQPPSDLMHRWAAQAGAAPAEAEAQKWLGDALDREGHYADSHPTLRARLAALALPEAAQAAAPPPLANASAAQAWLGSLADTLRAEFEARWADNVAAPWAERYDEAQQERQRLAELRALPAPDADEQLEVLRLTLRLEPEADLREALAAFNAAHVDMPLGLFLEGSHRLDQGEPAGIDLLERAIAIDSEATKPALARIHAFLVERKETAAAEACAERWQARDRMEALRQAQIDNLDPKSELVAPDLDAATLAAAQAVLGDNAPKHVSAIYLARRIIPADPGVRQWLIGVEISWWGRTRGKQKAIIDQLAAREWPLPLLFVAVDGSYAPLKKKFRALAGARGCFESGYNVARPRKAQ
ncbi:MAG: M48 family metallopeptidase [Desulfobulbus sp.]|nr:M48 family metallopeptidase [Desulfobulbus sp.]